MFVVMSALLALAAGAPADTSTAMAPAGADPAAPTQPVTAPKQDPNRIVCRTEQVIGSRFPHKICMTAADANERKRQDQENLRKAQDQTPAPLSR